MPHTTEESGIDTTLHTGSSVRIATWWNKFHFSGRVIICSVLFGLGLVLIGGLVFAINMDEDPSKPNSENLPEQLLPTKPPSKYVGPVIMGIGGFIVIVGVIMCLFETQVCRKKTGDSSPLISEKIDPEAKDSEAVGVPSSSNSHKSNKHGARKACTSPKKSKCRHAKSHSKEKSQPKRSPPVTIEKSKGFMTSSEDKFLTPPNKPDEDAALKQTNSHNEDIQSSSSLMKSFTSSGPSWNQSTEFLTPSTSFKATSISLNNSVEVDEKQQQVNFKIDAEYMTPLTVEEDRIQKLLIRVKNEQKEITKRETEDKMSEINFNVRSENDVTNPSGINTETVETIETDTKIRQNTENKNISTLDLPSDTLRDTSDFKDTNKSQSAELKNVDKLEINKHNHEKHYVVDGNTVHTESLVDNNKAAKEILETCSDTTKNFSLPHAKKQEGPTVRRSSTSFSNENKHNSDLYNSTETSDDKNSQNDLDNSVSSDETIVSTDNFNEKSKNNENIESTAKEDSNNQPEAVKFSESLANVKSAAVYNNSDDQNARKDDDVGTHGINDRENDTKVDKHAEVTPTSANSSS